MGSRTRDVEELLAERGIEVDHVTVYRWVQRFTRLLVEAARLTRHSPGDRWFVDETYVKVNGVWRYVYRAIDQHGQVIDMLLTRSDVHVPPAQRACRSRTPQTRSAHAARFARMLASRNRASSNFFQGCPR